MTNDLRKQKTRLDVLAGLLRGAAGGLADKNDDRRKRWTI